MSKKEILKMTVVWLKNLIILLAVPIFFTFVFGTVYSKTFVEQIPTVIVDQDNSSISRSIIKQFDESEGFKIVKYVDSENELKELIKRKKAYAGLVIPKDFQKNMKEMNAPKTLFIVDQTNLVIGNNAFAYGSEILNTLNAGVQMKVLEAKGMNLYSAKKTITSMSFVQRVIYDPQISYMKYLMFGIIGVMIQQTFLEVLAPMLIEDKKKLMNIKFKSKDGLKHLGKVIGRILFVSVCTIIQFAICFYIVGKYFNLPIRGIVLYDCILLLIFILNLIAVCFVFAAIFKEVLPCVQICLFLSVPAILTCGYVWPDFMMPKGLYNIVNMIWPLGSFINPLRNINMKGANFEAILPYVNMGLRYTAVWLPLGVGLYILRIALDKFLQNKKLNKAKAAEVSA
ncbi:ABC transporter permease [Clostridium aestuarii]|uniref:ABC transporter permease n=1 Tax=Clostridium aestuarii TaxID=338193 RepID=A0ABT4CVD2_9CLOT|nr:ABC transporter permease [Clostridium aestuarii]MCY6482944.1 ABC transporter permease [Clostridium aestuarii]